MRRWKTSRSSRRIALAAQNRSDLKAAEAQVHAAEFSRKAAVAERYPTLDVVADYGVIGMNPANSHGTFSVHRHSSCFPSGREDIRTATSIEADAISAAAPRANTKTCAPAWKRTCETPIWI